MEQEPGQTNLYNLAVFVSSHVEQILKRSREDARAELAEASFKMPAMPGDKGPILAAEANR